MNDINKSNKAGNRGPMAAADRGPAAAAGLSVFDYKARQEGVSRPLLSALGRYKGWQEIKITVDSGASDTVMPLSLCADIPVLASMQSKSGLEYEVANGASIPNEGERKC